MKDKKLKINNKLKHKDLKCYLIRLIKKKTVYNKKSSDKSKLKMQRQITKIMLNFLIC